MDFAEVFAWDSTVIGNVVVAGGDNEFSGNDGGVPIEAIHEMHGEPAFSAVHGLDALILPDVEFVVCGHVAVVLQRLIAAGLGMGLGNGISPISSSSEVVKKVMCEG